MTKLRITTSHWHHVRFVWDLIGGWSGVSMIKLPTLLRHDRFINHRQVAFTRTTLCVWQMSKSPDPYWRYILPCVLIIGSCNTQWPWYHSLTQRLHKQTIQATWYEYNNETMKYQYNDNHFVNRLRTGDVYMYQRTWSSEVQVIACRLLAATLLSGPIVIYHQTSNIIYYLITQLWLSRKCPWSALEYVFCKISLFFAKLQCVHEVHMESMIISNAAHHVMPSACWYDKYATRYDTLWLMIFVFHAFGSFLITVQQARYAVLFVWRKILSMLGVAFFFN